VSEYLLQMLLKKTNQYFYFMIYFGYQTQEDKILVTFNVITFSFQRKNTVPSLYF